MRSRRTCVVALLLGALGRVPSTAFADCPRGRSRADGRQPRRGPRGAAVPAQRGARRALAARAEGERPAAPGGGRATPPTWSSEGYFSHTARGGATFVDRILDAGYARRFDGWRWARTSPGAPGELATPRGVMDAWMDSPGHRHTILAPRLPRRRLRGPARRPAVTTASARPFTADFGVREQVMLRPTLLVLAGSRAARAAPRTGPRTADPRRDARANSRDVNLRRRRRRTRRPSPAARGRPRRPPGAATRSVRRHRARGLPARTRAQIKVVYAHAADRPEPLRRLGRRAAGQRRDRPALPVGAGRRDEGDPVRHGHALRAGVRGHPDRRAARAARRATPATSARSPRPSQAALGDAPARATRSSSPTSCRPPASSTAWPRRSWAPAASSPAPATRTTAAGSARSLFSRDGVDAARPRRRGWWPEGFLHEITHTLGAVQWGAPHSTQPRRAAGPALRPLLAGRRRHVLRRGRRRRAAAADRLRADRGHDHARATTAAATTTSTRRRAPGSYLATHWNTYDSAFLAPCAELAPACGGGDAARRRSRPAATAGPAIAGASRRGTRAAGRRPGTWINRPSRYAYQWQRQSGRSVARHRRRDRAALRRRPRATSAGACA